MSESRGLVLETYPDQTALVAVDRKEACGGCHETHKCRTCLGSTVTTAVLTNSADARSGDVVRIHMKSRDVLRSAALLYLVPVFGLVIGALAGTALAGPNATAAALGLGLLGFGLGFLIPYRVSHSPQWRQRITPEIRDIVDRAGDKGKDALPRSEIGTAACPHCG